VSVNNKRKSLFKNNLIHNIFNCFFNLFDKSKLRKRLIKINITMLRIEVKSDFLRKSRDRILILEFYEKLWTWLNGSNLGSP